MIKVIVSKDKIVISGHAGFAECGKDIVCSSVSTLVTTTINAILRFDENAIKYENNNDTLTIDILKNTKETKILIDNMISILNDLEDYYEKFIKIKKGD